MRVGGSSWRPKIDHKRSPKKNRNDLEEHRTIIAEKKDNREDKQRQYELPKCFDGVWPGTGPPARKRKGEEFGRSRPPGSHHIRAVREH